LTLLTGCSATAVLNAVEPRGGVTIARDIAYGEGARGTLDIYQPRRPASPGPTPVVIFFYGGNWDSGAKADYGFVGAALARRGYLTLIPDYRLFPQARWPDFLEDGAQATRWAKDHAADYGGDPAKLVLMGHSAGAYNAVSLALDGRWLRAVGMEPDRDLAAVAGLSGPYDFLPLRSERLKAIFGPEEQRADTQPINHVSPAAPPLWLGTSRRDTVVLPRNAINLAREVQAAGGRVELHVYERPSHALMVGAIAAPLRPVAPVLRDVSRFIDQSTRTTAR
jgi:acetyl esterase/lipase